MAEYLVNKLPDEVLNHVSSFLTVDEAEKAYDSGKGKLRPGPLVDRLDPAKYLAKTFKYSLSLLATMADEGCLLSWEEALRFMIPSAAINPNPSCDFIVPGNMKAVSNMLAVLSECGVQWDLFGDRLDKFMDDAECIEIEFPKYYLDMIRNWKRISPLPGELTLSEKSERRISFLAPVSSQVDDIRRAKRIRRRDFYGWTIKVTKNAGGDGKSGVVDAKPPSIYDKKKDRGSVINGVVEKGGHTKKVRLLLTLDNDCPLGDLGEIYGSHMECFISGWCAVHLHYDRTKKKEILLWTDDEVAEYSKDVVAEYENMGYEFLEPQPQKKFPKDRLSVNSDGAMIVAFDGIYRDFINYSPDSREMISEYVSWRKAGLDMISWYFDAKGHLQMDINRELQRLEQDDCDLVEQPGYYFNMFEHIAKHAPEDTPQILRKRPSDKFIQEIMTSGEIGVINITSAWSFLL